MQEPTTTHDDGDARRVLQGREAWQQALRDALLDPGVGWCMYSDDYRDWPLGEAAVVQALQQWAFGLRNPCVRVLARDYSAVVRDFPRFVRWRTDFGHVLECRELPAGIEAPPEGLWLQERGVLALTAQRNRRSVLTSGGAWRSSLEAFEQAWEVAEPGFVSRLLGL